MEVGSLVNQRPIGHIPNDPDDGAYLCPNDMLLGRASTTVPHVQGPFKETRNPRHRVEFIQRIVDSFWKRWVRDGMQSDAMYVLVMSQYFQKTTKLSGESGPTAEWYRSLPWSRRTSQERETEDSRIKVPQACHQDCCYLPYWRIRLLKRLKRSDWMTVRTVSDPFRVQTNFHFARFQSTKT